MRSALGSITALSDYLSLHTSCSDLRSHPVDRPCLYSVTSERLGAVARSPHYPPLEQRENIASHMDDQLLSAGYCKVEPAHEVLTDVLCPPELLSRLQTLHTQPRFICHSPLQVYVNVNTKFTRSTVHYFSNIYNILRVLWNTSILG